MNFVRSDESIIPAYLSLCVDDGVFVRQNGGGACDRMNRTWLLATIEASIKKSLENNPSAGRGEREAEREREKDRRDTSRARRGSDSNSTHN